MHFKKNYPLFIFFIVVLYNCGGNKLPAVETVTKLPDRKVYVVLRSEGDTEQLKSIIANDFLANNVSTNFSTYQARQAWNQNQIFQTAYNDNYDYILLVDQVAKFTIDGRTQVGAKYQLRSYHVKSPDPNWLDLGQETCNISVKPSIQKFSRILTRSIVGNTAVFKEHDFEYDDSIVSTSDNNMQQTQSLRGLSQEIERLKKELEAEKQRTKLAEQEKIILENKLTIQKQRKENTEKKRQAKLAQIELEKELALKRERERKIAEAYQSIKQEEELAFKQAEERRRLVELKQKEELARQKVLMAENKRKEEEKVRKLKKEQAHKRTQERRLLAQQKTLKQERLKAQKRRAKELAEEKPIQALKEKQIETETVTSNTLKKARKGSNNVKESSIKTVNAYIAIVGKVSESKFFKDLKDTIEFDFMFAKAKSNIEIFNTELSPPQEEIASKAGLQNNLIITIQQKEYVGDGKYQYEISFIEKQTGDFWKSNMQEICNLSIRDDLKRLSRKVTEVIPN